MKVGDLKHLLQSSWHPESFQDVALIDEKMRAMGIEPGSYYQELEMSSLYVDTHQDTSFSNSTIHLHSHTFYELLCCRNTCGVEYMIGSQRYRLQKGDIVFVAPGVSHRPILPEELPEGYCRDVLWISKEFLRQLASCIPAELLRGMPETNLLRTAGTPWEYLADKFRIGVLENERRDDCWELAVISNTASLMVDLWRALHHQPVVTQMRAEAPNLLDQVMAYIEKNLAQRISLGDTAKHFYVSESTISHLFRQKMGVSFYRCVTQRRLISAKELIRQALPMETVALQVGFADYSSFYRAFKREFGVSPKQYRKLTDPSAELD